MIHVELKSNHESERGKILHSGKFDIKSDVKISMNLVHQLWSFSIKCDRAIEIENQRKRERRRRNEGEDRMEEEEKDTHTCSHCVKNNNSNNKKNGKIQGVSE